MLPLLLFPACSNQERIPQEILNQYPETVVVSVHNPLDAPRPDAPIVMDVEKLRSKASDFNERAMVVTEGGREIPSQWVADPGGGMGQAIITLADFLPLETKHIAVHYKRSGEILRNYPQRTQAEISVKTGGLFRNRKYEGGTFQNIRKLRVPDEHTDHSDYIRYEGPGWESDRVGYRFYLDWRNAIDIFGKKTSAMVLQDVGQDGFESYHAMSDWGMDVLKVGETLGLGSLAEWHGKKALRVAETDSVTCEIVASGPLFSMIRTKYFGWKTAAGHADLVSELSIFAGSRATRHEIRVSGAEPRLCTGIVKLENGEPVQSSDMTQDWSFLATYGKQSLAEDNLGMAVLYKSEQCIEKTADEGSHVAVLKSPGGRLEYYFLAAWEKEKDGIADRESFVRHLSGCVKQLDVPLLIAY
ncbi:DUF4861 domain-containing protein [bacterium]|nr:DUF4861 domain-containing protein [bacterium]